MLPKVIAAVGVNEAFARGLDHLNVEGIPGNSRNGKVLVSPGPVITATQEPLQRVLFSPLRDANPFFHLFEALWMLAGRNDLPWLVQFNSQFASYSDDGGKTMPAAYGHRWRRYFRYDQLESIVQHLSNVPNSRRAVLTMWDAWPLNTDEEGVWTGGDLEKVETSKDVPCNTNVFFQIRDGEFLDISVQCRSNDAIWGAHGSNAVHFSILQEYMAARLDLAVGIMYQYSFNYHAYPDNMKSTSEELVRNTEATNFYRDGGVKPTPLFDSETVCGGWERELAWFMRLASEKESERSGMTPLFTEPFFMLTALPMLRAWRAHKMRDYNRVFQELGTMPSRSDWRLACEGWMSKRRATHERKMIDA